MTLDEATKEFVKGVVEISAIYETGRKPLDSSAGLLYLSVMASQEDEENDDVPSYFTPPETWNKIVGELRRLKALFLENIRPHLNGDIDRLPKDFIKATEEFDGFAFGFSNNPFEPILGMELFVKLYGPIRKIAEVRAVLNQTGCVEFNPFFLGLPASALSQRFQEIAKDANDAVELLTKVTGAKPIQTKSVFEPASNLSLSERFSRILVAPDQALRALEKEGGPFTIKTTKEAMEGLQEIVLFAQGASEYYQRHEMHG